MRQRLAVWVCIFVVAAAPLEAQFLIEGTEDLAFDRTESWAMRYFASLSILTGMGVPERMGAGAIDLGFEGGIVPQLDEGQRRVGFNGTKLENLNRTRFFGRVRAHIGITESMRLELAYLPPVDLDGIEPNLFAVGIGRPFELSESLKLGARGYAQLGTIRGDITCAKEEVAAGADPEKNPFGCEAPSNDRLSQKLYGGEVTFGYDDGGKWRPYAGIAFNYLDLEFQVDALYSGLLDRTLQRTDGGTVSVTGGLSFLASPKWRLSGELFYTWLSVVRPPDSSQENDGLLNARFLVTYRIR